MKGSYNELRHSLLDITQAMGKAMGLKLTGTFQVYKVCTIRKDRKAGVSKLAVVHSKIKGNLFFDICSPSKPTFGVKNIGC